MLDDVSGVRTMPIDTPAQRTHCEAFLREIDKRRDLFEYIFFIDLPELGVALDAS